MQTCFIIMQYIVSFSTLSDCSRTSPNNWNALDSGTVEPVTNRLLTAVTNSSRDPRHRDTPATITYRPDSQRDPRY